MVGVAAIAIAGSANAGGPVVLADAQMDRVTAGQTAADLIDLLGGRHDIELIAVNKNLTSTTTNNVNFNATSNIQELLVKQALILALSNVQGNSAALAFDNEAIGNNTHVQGDFSQITKAGVLSSQSGTFISAANN